MHVQANISQKPNLGFISDSLIPSFGMFVQMFMLISAFSMCCGYYDKIKNSLISPKEFYTRRVKRIFPFFALMTIIDVVWEHSISSLFEGIANITLFFNFFQRGISVIGVGWFIGIIAVFYMLFPCFVVLMDNKKRGVIVVLVSILLEFIAKDYFKIHETINFSLYFSTFTIGGLIYLYRKQIINLVSKYYVVSFLICVFVTFLFYKYNWGLQLLTLSLWTSFAIGKNNIVLSNKAIDFLSGISMEIYLCHMFFFRIVQKCNLDHVTSNFNVNYIFACIIALIGAIIFSYLVKYKIINKILLKLP